MRATGPGGRLVPIQKCFIKIGDHTIVMDNIPDVSDSKGASYNQETVPGRSTPIVIFSHSDQRTVGWTANFLSVTKSQIETNLRHLRAICSAVYPQDGDGNAPFLPPIICQIQCGKQLADDPLMAILRSYNFKPDRDMPFDEETLMPYKFAVDMNFEIVYESGEEKLPGSDRILNTGL